MKVRAVRIGFYAGHLISPGVEFEYVWPAGVYSLPSWVTPVQALPLETLPLIMDRVEAPVSDPSLFNFEV